MKVRTMLVLSLVSIVVLFAGFFLLSPAHHAESFSDLGRAAHWQQMASPGDLSAPHAFLGDKCASCHTPVKGAEAKNCIACHADNKSLLQRAPTAFHAEIAFCVPCHREHKGRLASTTEMDHAALAGIGARQIGSGNLENSRHAAVLNCAVCHKAKDKHAGFFGNDCAQCHGTTAWMVPGFRHPSAASQACAQCHQAPPSHYMMHFEMVSMQIAGVEHADVRQCHLCHQTTSWNDIRGVGYYKHH
jgi:hypothetical protein